MLLRLDPPQTNLPRLQFAAICTVIFLTALGVRLLYWQDNYAELLRGRRAGGLQMVASFYYDQAKMMLDDGGILFPGSPIDPGDATILTHPPGYSIMMVTILKLFHGEGGQEPAQADSGLRIVQIVFDAISCVVVFLIAAEIFPFAIGIVAAMLASLSPHFATTRLCSHPIRCRCCRSCSRFIS